MDMNTTILREEIQGLLEAIHEQYQVIGNYDDKIPQIEFDILMENVRKLYETLHLLNRTNDSFNYLGKKKLELEAVPVKPAKTVVRSETEANKEEPVSDAMPAVAMHFKDAGGTKKGTSPLEQEDQGQNLDLFSTGPADFSDKLQQARHRSLGQGIRKSGPNDLKGLISINEKFLFINELFDGNLREYNDNIDALNRFSDLRSALEFLDLLRKKSLWSTGSTAFGKLKELLEQRFR